VTCELGGTKTERAIEVNVEQYQELRQELAAKNVTVSVGRYGAIQDILVTAPTLSSGGIAAKLQQGRAAQDITARAQQRRLCDLFEVFSIASFLRGFRAHKPFSLDALLGLPMIRSWRELRENEGQANFSKTTVELASGLTLTRRGI